MGRGRALVKITEQNVTSFIWKKIVCRFCITYALITNNEKQFDNTQFNKLYEELSIKHFSSSPTHPQANGQVEAINKIINRGLKTNLEALKSHWAEDFTKVLWS